MSQPPGSGRFQRKPSVYRSWVTPDGAPGPTGEGGFRAEPGRYHLYVSSACPWAHRTLILRELEGLSEMISLSVVHWRLGSAGWSFEPGPGVIADPVADARLLSIVPIGPEQDFTAPHAREHFGPGL